ncbi:uncharacterized protein LOC127006009 [Eriocheir sinensis]|uniref:uncharacterized protein LOC127006009 n=1 Tax=Eriocheir sinensis TaxID=95602 RepID=UPI0021C8A02C|nr:uncharacterized protein LOC127006009 [Eriocheir sinensis]
MIHDTVNRGRPTPTVVWLVSEVWRAPVTEDTPRVISAALAVPQLTHRRLHAVLECRAFNFNGSLPAFATATLNVNSVLPRPQQDHLRHGASRADQGHLRGGGQPEPRHLQVNLQQHLGAPAHPFLRRHLTGPRVGGQLYAPESHLDYGTLLSRAFNSIGEQSVPCAFAIIPAGHPDPPKNCFIANQTTETIEVECVAGFDGGLQQTFYIEAESERKAGCKVRL